MQIPLHLPQGLSIRMARDSDKPFIAQLHRSSRDDLCLIDASEDFIETLIEQQYHAQTVGYGDMFPNAMYFIIEKQSERIGRVVIDFGMAEVRLIDLVFIPLARGKGYGADVLKMLQNAAAINRVPLVLSVLSHNQAAKALYLRLGFIVTGNSGTHEQMTWYPQTV